MALEKRNAIMITLMAALAGIVLFYDFSTTGNVLPSEGGAANAAPGTTTTSWPGSCSRPCSLAGGVGMLDISGNCISVQRFYDEKLCCVQADCGDDICSKGSCIIDKISAKKLVWPVDSRDIMQCFGWKYDRNKQNDWEFNHGMDINLPEGSDVKAMHTGRVLNIAEKDSSLGNYIVIADESGLYYTVYGYLKCGSIEVALGDYVKEGDKIAESGGSDDCRGAARDEELYIEIRYEKNEKESGINPCLSLEDCDCGLSCRVYNQRNDATKCKKTL